MSAGWIGRGLFQHFYHRFSLLFHCVLCLFQHGDTDVNLGVLGVEDAIQKGRGL